MAESAGAGGVDGPPVADQVPGAPYEIGSPVFHGILRGLVSGVFFRVLSCSPFSVFLRFFLSLLFSSESV